MDLFGCRLNKKGKVFRQNNDNKDRILNSIVVGFVAFPLHRGTDGERYDESEKSEH
jgi:hypothetical protein